MLDKKFCILLLTKEFKINLDIYAYTLYRLYGSLHNDTDFYKLKFSTSYFLFLYICNQIV